jgi:fumarate reductase flavoprotein subunit
MGLDTGSGPGKIASTYMWKTGGICVNKDGNRFVKETEAAVEIRETTLEQQPEAVQYDIFTDKIIADAQEKKTAGFWNYYYAPDAPYHRVVVSAPTIAELAAKLGVNADNLAKTVASYNQHVEAGTDDEFGRKFKDTDLDGVYNVAVNKIEGDMYYAVPLHALCVLTLGGVKINANAQVLDNDQKPIPGLYAAGECVGGIWGEFASSGTGVMGPITFGRIAAEHAMSSDPATGYQPTKSSGVIAQDVFVKEEKETSAITFDMSQKLKDGTYETGVEGQEGTLKVQVTIQANKITDVKILEAHESSFTEEAQKKVPAAIVAANSLDVDGVSGATLTSTRIKQAVKNCLEQALQK